MERGVSKGPAASLGRANASAGRLRPRGPLGIPLPAVPPPPSFLLPPPRVPVSPSSGLGALAPEAGVGPGEPHGQSRGAHAWAE